MGFSKSKFSKHSTSSESQNGGKYKYNGTAMFGRFTERYQSCPFLLLLTYIFVLRIKECALICHQLGNTVEKKKLEVGGGSRSFVSVPYASFGMLVLHRKRLTKPCKRHRTRKILAFLLPRSPLGQECIEFTSLMQIQPLEKFHSCLITSIALVVVATEGFPGARVELSFALTRGLFEVFSGKKQSSFMLCQDSLPGRQRGC